MCAFNIRLSKHHCQTQGAQAPYSAHRVHNAAAQIYSFLYSYGTYDFVWLYACIVDIQLDSLNYCVGKLMSTRSLTMLASIVTLRLLTHHIGGWENASYSQRESHNHHAPMHRT